MRVMQSLALSLGELVPLLVTAAALALVILVARLSTRPLGLTDAVFVDRLRLLTHELTAALGVALAHLTVLHAPHAHAVLLCAR
jgi:hypothetical protein